MLYLTQLTGFVLITLINGEMNEDCTPDCPCLTDPPELVVRYGDSVSFSCRPFFNGTDLSWKIARDNMLIPHNGSFTLENWTDWEIQLMCQNGDQCNRTLPLTIYKLPDQVSISTVNHTGPMIEGRVYELQCDVQNVAPLKLLTVNWYKEDELVSNINFSDNSTKSPVNQSTRLQISPSANDDGVKYKCEAKLNLGPRGPQDSPSNMTSNILNIAVNPCPDLVLDPPELVVRYGDPVSVSCRSLSEYADLGWDVSLGNVLSLDNQTVIWKTDNLTDWEIVPVCYMILNGVQCRRTLSLTVYKLPDEVSFSIVNHVGPMIEGKKYELQCDVYNFAPVYVLAAFWYKGEELLKNRGFADLPTKTPSNKTVSHKITAGRDEGEAQYWCEAKLKLGPAGPQPSPTIKSNLLKVAVHYKPVIKPCSDWSPMINTPLSSFPYIVTGNPTPTITWKRDKSPVSSDMILSRNDSGTYELLAINNEGKASCVIKITVEYAPTFKCPAIYEGKEHDSFLDKCLVMASPVANISWEKDGKTANPLYNPTRGDSGSYVITAVNKHGVEKHSLTVNVLYGPEIKSDNSSHVMQKGEAVSLSCTAEGNPQPEVIWSFQSQTKATGRRQTTLTISEATFADDGVYTCTAMNDLGNDTRTVTVNVEDCPVKIRPVKLVVEFGDSASANCSTTIIHHGMGWEASQGAVDLKENVQLLIWRVDHLTHWDIQPICFILVEEQCAVELPVTVYKRPDRVSISTVNHTGPMIEGRQYKLRCDVQNVAPVRLLTVNWYKGHHLVKRESVSGENKFPVNENVTLQISPSKDDDGVQYRCEAELNLAPEGPQPPPIVTSDALNITVHYKPKTNCSDWSPVINTPLSSYPYNVTGKPTPNITWHRDKSLVSSDMILSRNDSGQYTLFASNLMGNASCVISITVEYAPTFACLPSYEGREHDSFLDKCSIMASPVATITWEKDGKTVNPLHHLTKGDSGTYVITATNKHGTQQHSFTINVLYKPETNCLNWSPVINTPLSSYPYNVTGKPTPNITWHRDESPVSTDMILSRNNSGQYTLFARNLLGNASCVINIKIEYAPTFACLPSYEGREHDSFLDKCSVIASPVATITWVKDGKTVNPLYHLTKGDSGTYVITATNKRGTQQHSLTINVLYKAKIQSNSPSKGVNVGEKVSLQCTAEGNPVPEVRWTFQNQNRTTGKQHTLLNIDKAKSADAGQYTCIATNELGRDTKTVSLTVQEINLRLIIILTVLSLVILFFIIYIIYKCIQRRRSGRYNVQTNGAVGVPLVQRNNENERR